jgi:hypothetical protein
MNLTVGLGFSELAVMKEVDSAWAGLTESRDFP